jgi:hypothetical protein
MWVVFEMEELGLTDELCRLHGPFDSREDAESFCAIRGYDGVMEVEKPDE